VDLSDFGVLKADFGSVIAAAPEPSSFGLAAAAFGAGLVLRRPCKRRRGTGRGGFSLVELLVVVAIIGVLIALLLPAVQAARESARRVTCANHLKQLGLAVHHYHDAFGQVPSLYNGSQPPGKGTLFGHQSHSWRTAILPQLEQQPLFNSLDLSQHATHGVNQPEVSTPLEVFVCPSTPRPGRTNTPTPRLVIAGLWLERGAFGSALRAAVADYAAAEGYLLPDGECVAGPWGEPDYGYATATRLDQATVKKVRFADVTDGLSNTILVWERAALPDHYYSGGADVDLHDPPEPLTWGNFGPWAIAGESRLNHLRAEEGMPLVNEDNARGLFSFHPGIVQLTLADGAVRRLSEDVERWVLLGMATREGGEAVDGGSLR
jgi:prepilin-type N-terminal cleavage/methylation domain-containing protein